MPASKIDEKKLMKLVNNKVPVEKIDKELGINNMAYTRTKIKDAIAKQNAANYPGLYVGKGVKAIPSKPQPKLTESGSINLTKKLLKSWGIELPKGTAVQMKVNHDKNKITLILGESDKTQETPKKETEKKN